MGSGPIDPLELLKGLDNILSQSGEVKALEGMAKIFNLMKQSQKMVNRCIYLNIVLQTHSPDILSKFIRVGGYKLLNSWMTYARTCNNSPLLHQILLTLQHLPLTVDHLKQNNTAKLVKQLSKSSEDEELRKLAGILVNDWMAVIRSQSNIQPADKEKKKKKEDPKGCSPVPDKTSETKSEDSSDKKKEKPKTLRTSAPSHAKFRSTGLEVEAPSLVPVKKPTPVPVLSDKYLKPIPVKRQSSVPVPGDVAPAEKKYKPLNTVPNTTKEIKVKIIPPQPMESLGFLDALNSAPVAGIKIKKKKKASSPTSNKPSPFDSKSPTEASSLTKPSSPEPEPPVEGMEVERPGTPVPAIELPEPMEISAPPPPLAPSETKPNEADASLLTKKGKKRKTVSWPEESRLREYFYFELDETERVNVNKIKDFGEAAKREMMKDRQAFQNARRLSHDTMEEVVPWVPPRLLSLPGALVQMGSNSTEKHAQAEREMGILQEIFLSKESVPDTPHEPDPESYEPSPPKLIPLDEDCSMDDGVYPESMDQSIASQSPDSSGAKLPPVLANLMGSMGSSKSPPNPLPGTMQEILTSIMGAQGNANPEDLMKQPDLSEKIKHLLGSLQNQNQNQGPPGPAGQGSPGSVNNGFSPPSQKNYQPPPPLHHQPPPQHYPPPGPNGPFQGPHGPPGGPRMMGPPPPQRDGYWEPPPNENMRGGGGHHGGGMRGGDRGPPPPPFHRNRGGRGGEPGYRGRGRGGERGHPGRNGPYGMGHGDHRGHGGHGGEHRGRGEGHRGRGEGHRGRGEGHRGHGEGHRGHGEGHRGHGGHGDHRGHGHGGDMSTRPTCRHFMMKGNCRYENNCAFYHPGINGPPLP